MNVKLTLYLFNQWVMIGYNYTNSQLNNFSKKGFSLLTSFSLFFILGDKIVRAQSIIQDNTTNTSISIDPNLNQYNITGGESAGNNIFHSFETFGLTQGEIANFLSELETRNIFGRVTGGDASVINGLLKITGGTPNLFFINPAGIIFGENSSINVPASFTATTANGIQIGNFWFDALGNNNYANLVGEPSGFAFLGSELGSIINLGDINVGVTEDLSLNEDGLLINSEGNVIFGAPTQNPGDTINLVGGLVINTGTLKTPGGTINIVAVPEQQLVRITPEGSLLSILLPTEAETILQPGIDSTNINPPSLPELLTGGGITEATAIAVVDGVVRLTGSDTEVPQDIGTNIVSGNIDTFNNLGDGGNININGEKVGVLQGNIDASGRNGGSISISSEGVGIEPFSTSSRILFDSNSFISATGIGVFEPLEDFPTPGTGGTIRINSNGAIALDATSPNFFTSISNIDVSGIDGTVELKAQNNIVTINSDNALDFYLDGLPNYLDFNAIDNITLESNDIQIIGENSNLGTTAIVNGDINLNNFLATETIPTATIVIPVNNLTTVDNVTVEASNNLVVERDILVSNNPQFIGALLEPENIDSDQGIPLEDIPIFQNLTLRVDPAEGEIGLLDIQGSFAVTNDLLLENTNGDIVIEPQLPQFIDFINGDNFEYLGSNGGLFVGLNSLLLGVEPHGDLRNNLGSVTIDARQGSVKLLRGITLNADTDLNIATQKLIGSGTTTLLGNGLNGEPGRIDSELVQTYTIGVISFGGDSLDAAGQPIFDELGEVQLSEEGSADPEPQLQLVVGFNFNAPNLIQPEPIVLAGDENTDAISNIEIFLLSDQSFVVGEFESDNESGIAAISKISRIRTNGSLIDDVFPVEETSIAPEVILPETPETPVVTEIPETPVVTETPEIPETPMVTDIPETSEPEIDIIPNISELDLEVVSASISRRKTLLNDDFSQELATKNDDISLEIDLDSEVVIEAKLNISNNESTTDKSVTEEPNLVTTNFPPSDLDETENNLASRREIASNVSSQQLSITTHSTFTFSNETEYNSNSTNPISDDVINQTNNTINLVNSNLASEVSNAASEPSNTVNQVNSNNTNSPVTKTSPLPENNFDPSSQVEDNSTVALLLEESEVSLDNNSIKYWIFLIVSSLLLLFGIKKLLTNALASSILDSLASYLKLKLEINNSHSNSDQGNPQQNSKLEMKTTIKPGIIQLSKSPILDWEISLELEPDPGNQIIHTKDNLVDHDQVKVQPE